LPSPDRRYKIMERVCLDTSPKQFLLEFDGGNCGNYTILVCKECYSEIDKEFLVREEKV
jgi:hypothetical protein